MGAVVSLPLDLLMLDADIQPRETMSKALIQEYAELYRDGHPLPPITVVQEGQKHWVADGFHREGAARQAGLSEIQANVEAGTKRDAMLYSCGANKHGKARTPEDKRRAIRRLLADPEWQGWSNVEIARHCGVAQSFVAKIRRSLCSEQSDEAPRTYRTRHGTIATMDTSRIGRTREASVTEELGTSAIPGTAGNQVVQHDLPVTSAIVPELVAIDMDDGCERGTEVVDTAEIPRPIVEAAFPSIAELTKKLMESVSQSKTPTPLHPPSNVLRLMGELSAAFRQQHDTGPAAAADGWSLELMHECVRTCSELIEQLQSFRQVLERIDLAKRQSPVVELGPNNAGSVGSHGKKIRTRAISLLLDHH